MARQRHQHACLSESAIAQSIALGCLITPEWTADTSMSTPPVCHDAAIHASHQTLSGSQGCGGGRPERRKRGVFCGARVPFIPSFSPHGRTLSASLHCSDTKSSKPPPRHIRHPRPLPRTYSYPFAKWGQPLHSATPPGCKKPRISVTLEASCRT